MRDFKPCPFCKERADTIKAQESEITRLGALLDLIGAAIGQQGPELRVRTILKGRIRSCNSKETATATR